MEAPESSQQILRQLHHYFSDDNLTTDFYLLNLMRVHVLAVPWAIIKLFPKIKLLWESPTRKEDLATIIGRSNFMTLDASGEKLLRIVPLPQRIQDLCFSGSVGATDQATLNQLERERKQLEAIKVTSGSKKKKKSKSQKAQVRKLILLENEEEAEYTDHLHASCVEIWRSRQVSREQFLSCCGGSPEEKSSWVEPSNDRVAAVLANIPDIVANSPKLPAVLPCPNPTVPSPPADPAHVLEQAFRFYTQGLYSQAVEELDALISRNPSQHPICTLFRCVNYLRKTQYVNVLDDTYVLMNDMPFASEPLRSYRGEIAYMRGIALFRLNYISLADKEFSRAASFTQLRLGGEPFLNTRELLGLCRDLIEKLPNDAAREDSVPPQSKSERVKADLFTAITANDLAQVRSLLTESKGVPLTAFAYDEAGYQPLHRAVKYDFVDIAAFLISLEPSCMSTPAQDISRTYPLSLCSFYGSYRCLKLLLDANADVNLQDCQRETALMSCWHAPEAGVQCAKLLVERKADLNLVNLNRMSALVLACLHRSHENGNAVAQFLIDAKADLNLRDRSDNSAYTWALKPVDDELCQQSGNDELCQQLVAAGADTRPARGIEVSLPPSDIASRDEVVERLLQTAQDDEKTTFISSFNLADLEKDGFIPAMEMPITPAEHDAKNSDQIQTAFSAPDQAEPEPSSSSEPPAPPSRFDGFSPGWVDQTYDSNYDKFFELNQEGGYNSVCILNGTDNIDEPASGLICFDEPPEGLSKVDDDDSDELPDDIDLIDEAAGN